MCKSAAGVLSLALTLTLLAPSTNAKEFVPKWLQDKCELAKSEPSCLTLSQNPSEGIGWRVYECHWHAGSCVVHQERLDMAEKIPVLRMLSVLCAAGFVYLGIEYLDQINSHPAHLLLSIAALGLGAFSWTAALEASAQYAQLAPKKADSAPTP